MPTKIALTVCAIAIYMIAALGIHEFDKVPTSTPVPQEFIYFYPDPAHEVGCWVTANGNGISCLYTSFETPTPNSFNRRVSNGY